MSDNIEEIIEIDKNSEAAERILYFLNNPRKRNIPPEMHYVINQYPQKLTYHIEPGVTAVIGYYASCPASIPDGMKFSVSLFGSPENRKTAKPILEKALDFEIG